MKQKKINFRLAEVEKKKVTIRKIQKTYYNNLKLLNPKAKYLKDEMTEEFNKE